jgi:hypothetical protein
MSRWRRLPRLLNLSCEEVSRLASASLDRPLTAAERWAVRIHTLYCSACRRFRRQAALIRRGARRLAAPDPAAPGGPPLPPEVRDRIVRALKDRS